MGRCTPSLSISFHKSRRSCPNTAASAPPPPPRRLSFEPYAGGQLPVYRTRAAECAADFASLLVLLIEQVGAGWVDGWMGGWVGGGRGGGRGGGSPCPQQLQEPASSL